MSLPRILARAAAPVEGGLVPLGAEQATHLRALRLKPGSALELLLAEGPWKADLAELGRDSAVARLVAPLREDREAPIAIEVFLPLTAQLSLMDDLIPPLVELGVGRIVPAIFDRSEFDPRKTQARMDRWRRILAGAVEQSHRRFLPELADPAPFEALLTCASPQKWVAYEVGSGQPNPALRRAPLALASGPEGGITDEEFQALRAAGWVPVHLGKAILRAVTAPVALMGAVQFELGRSAPA
jgi:16S rRNA (uracil1498-N3)-methyltransferase